MSILVGTERGEEERNHHNVVVVVVVVVDSLWLERMNVVYVLIHYFVRYGPQEQNRTERTKN